MSTPAATRATPSWSGAKRSNERRVGTCPPGPRSSSAETERASWLAPSHCAVSRWTRDPNALPGVAGEQPARDLFLLVGHEACIEYRERRTDRQLTHRLATFGVAEAGRPLVHCRQSR